VYAVRMPDVAILPEFIQWLGDDIVSLTVLTLIVNPGCRDDCLHHSADSVAVSDDSMSVEATSLSDVTVSDTRLH